MVETGIQNIKRVSPEGLAESIKIESGSPLHAYYIAKKIQKTAEYILDDKEFMKDVKRTFLSLSENQISKSVELGGATIKAKNISKQIAGKQTVVYSDEVNDMEEKIREMEHNLKNCKELCNLQKNIERNGGALVLSPVPDSLDNIQLETTFHKS